MQRERGVVNVSTHPSVAALTASILADERALAPRDREARYQRIVAACEGTTRQRDGETQEGSVSVRSLVAQARKTLTAHEERFWRESHTRWPNERWLRYHDISILPTHTIGAILSRHPSVWYAPFYHAKTKTIVVLDDRQDFPYRICGQNLTLYVQYGYTVLDFSEDFSCPTDGSVWDAMIAMVEAAIVTMQ